MECSPSPWAGEGAETEHIEVKIDPEKIELQGFIQFDFKNGLTYFLHREIFQNILINRIQ